MSEVNELVGLSLASRSTFNCSTIEQDLNDRNVAFEVAGVDVSLGQLVGRDRGIPLRRSKATVPQPFLQGQQRHRLFCVIELRRDSRTSAVACDRSTNIGAWNTCFPAQLEAKVWTVQAQTQPLTLGPVSPDPDPPLSSPSQVPFWGRGVGGDWEIHIPPAQPNGMPADLSAVSQIEIWISYQFRHASETVQ